MTNLPRWALMWIIAYSLYGLCKALTLLRVAHPFSQKGIWIYLLAWPGMNAPGFFDWKQPAAPRHIGASGILFIGTGMAVLFGAMHQQDSMLRGLLGMTALVFLLHFGLFRMLSDWWTADGWQAPSLMNAPVLATSLADFWGRRWNRAYRDLTHEFLYRPLSKRIKPAYALMTGFLISGLIHELVLTVPAGGGIGGPTVYFLLQGLGLLGEKRLWNTCSPRIITWIARALFLVPLPLLFPPVFIREVMAPFISALTPAL